MLEFEWTWRPIPGRVTEPGTLVLFSLRLFGLGLARKRTASITHCFLWAQRDIERTEDQQESLASTGLLVA